MTLITDGFKPWNLGIYQMILCNAHILIVKQYADNYISSFRLPSPFKGSNRCPTVANPSSKEASSITPTSHSVSNVTNANQLSNANRKAASGIPDPRSRLQPSPNNNNNNPPSTGKSQIIYISLMYGWVFL